jgi:RHS repeat-associated protein
MDVDDIGFTGHLFHSLSGLHLAPYRIYNADTAKWLSRDPQRQSTEGNLFDYASSSPIDFKDPEGLEKISFTVISLIRPPDLEAGVKTRQSVTVDTDSGNYVKSDFIGPTLLYLPGGTYAYPGQGTLNATVSGQNGCIDIALSGHVRSYFLPLSYISYDTIIHYRHGVTTVVTYHTSYPSFEVYENNLKVYDYQQGHLIGGLDNP